MRMDATPVGVRQFGVEKKVALRGSWQQDNNSCSFADHARHGRHGRVHGRWDRWQFAASEWVTIAINPPNDPVERWWSA